MNYETFCYSNSHAFLATAGFMSRAYKYHCAVNTTNNVTSSSYACNIIMNVRLSKTLPEVPRIPK